MDIEGWRRIDHPSTILPTAQTKKIDHQKLHRYSSSMLHMYIVQARAKDTRFELYILNAVSFIAPSAVF